MGNVLSGNVLIGVGPADQADLHGTSLPSALWCAWRGSDRPAGAYSECMASIPFTLAALATSAVPELIVFGVRAHEEDDSYVSAVVIGEEEELLVRIPRTQAAEVQQSGELLGLAALTAGPRSELPFAVPLALGMTRAGDTRAVVTTHLIGDVFDTEDLEEDAILIEPIAKAIAAIHALPHSVAQQGGLPVRSSQDLRLLATRLIDRAESTRLVPETVLRRWERIVESAEIWDFAPTMVHGSLDSEQLRVENDEITGVVGWSELSIGDPASDLAWLLSAGQDVLDSVLARYAKHRSAGSISTLRTRAALYHELEVARWLLHGTESHDQSVIDDAVGMLDRMVGGTGPLGAAFASSTNREPLSESEVNALLEETPEVNDLLSDTAAYEALEEDRMFGVDTDFIEPLPKEDAARDPEASANADSADGTVDAGTDADADADASESADASDSAGTDAHPDEQLTEPIDPDELPEPKRR